MLKRVHFPSSLLPYLLVAPQIAITLVFFIWPASQAVYQSFLIEDAFGLSTEFVWFENFELLFEDDIYLATFGRTIFFSAAVAILSMSMA
ncbi:MAG: glycerol-3-phosphate transporter permease, partial [Tritonibacter mobilis]|nr:glycerol-3-phosphate transporter permease [Tritonibacter mobilis]